MHSLVGCVGGKAQGPALWAQQGGTDGQSTVPQGGRALGNAGVCPGSLWRGYFNRTSVQSLGSTKLLSSCQGFSMQTSCVRPPKNSPVYR